MKKRLLATLLCLCMVVTLLPSIALAVDSPNGVMQLGTADISDPTKTTTEDGDYYTPNSYIYYGQANGTAPIKWRVLDADKNSGGTDGMFLMSEYLLDSGNAYFDKDEPYSNVWAGSHGQAWCKDFAGVSGAAEAVVDAFSENELMAVQSTTKTDDACSEYGIDWAEVALDNEKVFFISAAELKAYVGNYQNAPRLKAYPEGSEAPGKWWLRSSPGLSILSNNAGIVSNEGMVVYNEVNAGFAARPAFNLDLNSVLFTSAAVDGKSTTGMDTGLTAVKTNTGNDWKLTLKDADRSFAISNVIWSDNTVTFDCAGAYTGTNEYISAAVLDEGKVLYYGRIMELDAATKGATVTGVDITLPSDVTLDEDTTLQVFNEQYNGDKKTDYASELVKIETHLHSWSTEWTRDDTYHWHECKNADCPITENSKKDGYGMHIYDNEEDFLCNTCDYQRPYWILNTIVDGGSGGSFAPDGAIKVPKEDFFSYSYGKTITFLPDIFHKLDEVLVDGTPISFTGNSYTFEDVSQNHTISASFKPVTPSDEYHSVTINAPAHGGTSPSGKLIVRHGYPIIIYIYPAARYELDQFMVNGVEMNVVGNSFTLPAVTEDCEVQLSFKAGQTPQIDNEIIAASTGANGSISPMGDVKIEKGGDMYFYLLPDEGYVVDEVIVNNKKQEVSENFYEFSNVTEKSSIHVSFKRKEQADIEKAKAAIEGRSWTVPQTTAATEATLKAWIERELAEMDLNAVSYTVNITDFTEAVEGDAKDRDGKNGSFDFTVSLSKGEFSDTASTSGMITPWVNPFTDISEDDWFYEDVVLINQLNLMYGTTPTTFSPYTDTTRSMIVTILYRMEDEPAVNGACPFDDVKSGSYYEKAITWAAANGIINGYGDDKFGPEDSLSREQTATILYRYAQFKAYDVSIGEETNILSYKDALDISKYAIPAMQWACGAGIIQGDGGNLMPTEAALRCQTATMLARFLNAAEI